MLKTLLAWHQAHYPEMTSQDIVKLVFQAYRGCGHLLGTEERVVGRIEDECARLTPSEAEPLTEPLGCRYVRLNLRRALHEGIRPLWIARLMLLSCTDAPYGTTEDVIRAIQELSDRMDHDQRAALLDARRPLELDANWLPCHSSAYHAHYAPAYRVIDRQAAALLPVLLALGKQTQERVMIAIDGRCGSGKSTFARLLASVLDAFIVPMDDFFTPHAQKTPERLALPGGNADVTRFRNEVIVPYCTNGAAAYRPYSCHLDQFMDAVVVPETPYLIVEGSYCLHPDTGRPYDVCVFMSVSREEQFRRILSRDGETMLQRFIHEWIPLEEAYFNAFGLPDASCIAIVQPDQC